MIEFPNKRKSLNNSRLSNIVDIITVKDKWSVHDIVWRIHEFMISPIYIEADTQVPRRI